MGCRVCSIRLNFGKALSKVFVLSIMILLFMYLFYSLVGFSDTFPIGTLHQQTSVSGYYARDDFQNSVRLSEYSRVAHPRNRTDFTGLSSDSPKFARQVISHPQQRMLERTGTGETVSKSTMPVSNTFGSKKFPQAIIIGVKKGGTRALLEFLRVHPDVRAVGAEPHFFDRSYDKGLEWYRNLMPRTLEGQVTMEKTPSYFVTKEAPLRVCAMNCDTKLIVVVRDPVTRAVSDYTQTLSKNPGLPSFQSLAFRNSSSSGKDTIDTSWSAVRIGLYAQHLESWLQHFPLSHFLFVSGERLVADPAGEMARVQDFLGLKRIVGDKHFYFNQTKGFPCLKKPEGSGRPRCLGKSKGRPHPLIPPEALKKLRDFYRPFNLKFYHMSGQDFGWD